VKRSSLPKDAEALLAEGAEVAAAVAEKRVALGIEIGVEAPLRASVEAAALAIDGYMAVLAGGKYQNGGLVEAKARCDRELWLVRRRIRRAGVWLRQVRTAETTGGHRPPLFRLVDDVQHRVCCSPILHLLFRQRQRHVRGADRDGVEHVVYRG